MLALLSLPAELLREILFYLDYESLSIIAKTNRSLRQIVVYEHLPKALADIEIQLNLEGKYPENLSFPCCGCFKILPYERQYDLYWLQSGFMGIYMWKRRCIDCDKRDNEGFFKAIEVDRLRMMKTWYEGVDSSFYISCW
jgi:F-box domain